MVSNVIWKRALPHKVLYKPAENAGLSPVMHCSLAPSPDCEYPESRETVLSILPVSAPPAKPGTQGLVSAPQVPHEQMKERIMMGEIEVLFLVLACLPVLPDLTGGY